MGLPPGPRSPLLSLFRIFRSPYKAYGEWAQRYGDPFTIRMPFGTVVMTGDPAGIKEIFAADPGAYTTWGVELMRPVLGEYSMLVLSGTRHKQMRKLVMPSFHGARMRAYGATMRDTARRHLAALTPGRSFTVPSLTLAISMEVIVRAVYGFNERARVDETSRALLELANTIHPAFLFFRALQRDVFGLGPYAKFKRARARVSELVNRQIAERRANPAGREDILAMLVEARDEEGAGLSDAQIYDQLQTLLGAGSETTAFALAWALYWLHRHDDARARLLAELDALGDEPDPERVARLPYLSAVCNETLRLRPIVHDMVRTLTRPMTLKGVELPAGVAVSAAASIVHERPELYPEPERWRPERFLERKFSTSEFLPFGGGHRRCVGAAFAVYELKQVLATVLREHTLRRVSDEPLRWVRRGAVMAPASFELIYEGPR